MAKGSGGVGKTGKGAATVSGAAAAVTSVSPERSALAAAQEAKMAKYTADAVVTSKLETTGYKVWKGDDHWRVYSGQDYVKVVDEGKSWDITYVGHGSSKRARMLAAVDKALD